MILKVIIAGGRDYSDYETFKAYCDKILSNHPNIEIISGRCPVGTHTFTTKEGIKVYGADGLAERYAEERKFLFTPFPADFKRFGRSAGPRRNNEMAAYGSCLIAFWDQESKGTKNIIELATNYALQKRIYKI